MEISQHRPADRLKVAEVSGAAENHVHRRTDLAEAVFGLRAITTDQHLLSHAAATYIGDDAVWPAAATLLELAGADLDEAAEIRRRWPPFGSPGRAVR